MMQNAMLIFVQPQLHSHWCIPTIQKKSPHNFNLLTISKNLNIHHSSFPHASNVHHLHNNNINSIMAFLPIPALPTQFKHKTTHHHSILPPTCTTRPPTPSKPPKPSPTTLPPTPPPPPPPPRLSNVQVFFERLNDTLLDARIHYTRLLRSPNTNPSPTTIPRVVILGSGWAAHSLVKVLDPGVVNATIISPRNFFFFTPLLSASAVGTVEFRSIVEPIRVANPFVDYFEAFAIDVDLDKQHVICLPGKREGLADSDDSFKVEYDFLVVAVGETTATFGIPGARQYAYFLKEISDARKLRIKILDTLEKAALPVWTAEERRDLLQFVVVGGGPTGCEFAGELSDFVQNDLSPRYGKELVSQIRVSLLQSGATLLSQFEESLQDLALKEFEGRVNVILNARVARVDEHEVVLQTGETIRYGLLVWAAGNGTRPIVGKLVEKITKESSDLAVQKRRKLQVDGWCRVKDTKHVFAVGDCAVVTEDALPATAQVAAQQGAFLGRLLTKAEIESIDGAKAPVLRYANGKKIHPFRFLSLGIMAYLGNQHAVVQVDATAEKKVKVGGGLAYALWRSVYAVKQVDVRNRILVLFDYFKSRVFGRDISQF